MYIYKSRKTTSYSTFFLITLFIFHHMSFGMDVSLVITPANLFQNNGAFLKQLVRKEAEGYYCPELARAEDVLREYFETQKSTETPDVIDQETCDLAVQLIHRYDGIPQLEKAVREADLELIENIVKANPYTLQCYSSSRGLFVDGDNKSPNLRINRYFPTFYYTILHTACGSNKFSQSSIEKLLDLGANPNVKTGMTFHTPLHYACNIQIAKLLIKRGALIDEPCMRGHTPLWRHIFLKDNFSIAAYLLKHKADPNRMDAKNRTIVEVVIIKHFDDPITVLTECAQKYALNLSIDFNKQMSNGTFLSEYILRRHRFNLGMSNKISLSEYIVRHDIFGLLKIRCEPCLEAKEPNIKFLIAHKGEGFKQVDDKKYALYDIARFLLFLRKHVPIVDDSKTGFKNRVIINDEDCFFYNASLEDFESLVGKESLEWALECVQQHCQHRFTRMQRERSFSSARSRFYLLQYDEKIALETFMFMIKSKNKSGWFDSQYYFEPSLVHGTFYDDRTLLHKAVRYKNEAAIKFFIERGVDFAAKDVFNKTAYDYAVDKKTRKYLEEIIISFLLTKSPYQVSKAQKQFLNATMIDRFYELEDPLLVLAMESNPEWVPEFLKHTIHVNKTNDSGLSALSCAIKTNNEKVVFLLLERGALVNKDMVLKTKRKNICLYKALQKAYVSQECLACSKHPGNMTNIPCEQYHATHYICKMCYDALPENSLCPICQGRLLPFPKTQSEINMSI